MQNLYLKILLKSAEDRSVVENLRLMEFLRNSTPNEFRYYLNLKINFLDKI